MERSHDQPTNQPTRAIVPAMTALATTVLLVEDDEFLSRDVAEWLGERGCVVHVAESVKTGLDLALLRHPDVVLLDLGLPDGSGLELIAALRDRGVQTPIVVFSVHEDPLELFDAARLGAVDFIQKPAAPDHIAAVIHRVARAGGDPLQQVVRRLHGGRDESARSSLGGWLVRASVDGAVDLLGFWQVCAALRLIGDDPDAIDQDEVLATIEAALRIRAALDERALTLLRAISECWTWPRRGECELATAEPTVRHLKDVTGRGIAGWERLARLRLALVLLLTTDEHVRQIAHSLGFAHGGQLSRDLHELTGLSPSEIRQVATNARVR